MNSESHSPQLRAAALEQLEIGRQWLAEGTRRLSDVQAQIARAEKVIADALVSLRQHPG